MHYALRSGENIGEIWLVELYFTGFKKVWGSFFFSIYQLRHEWERSDILDAVTLET